MHDYFDVIEIDNYFIFNIYCKIYISENILLLSIQLDSKHVIPNMGKYLRPISF